MSQEGRERGFVCQHDVRVRFETEKNWVLQPRTSLGNKRTCLWIVALYLFRFLFCANLRSQVAHWNLRSLPCTPSNAASCWSCARIYGCSGRTRNAACQRFLWTPRFRRLPSQRRRSYELPLITCDRFASLRHMRGLRTSSAEKQSRREQL